MKKFILIMLCMILLTVNATAFEFDNVKSFDRNIGKYGTITVKNMFGLGNTLAEIELQENTYLCGLDCYAEGEVILYKKGKLIELRFEKIKGILRSYEIYIADGGKWIKYNVEDLDAGTYKFRIEGQKDFFGKIDWLGTWFGVEVTEWAIWESGLTGFQFFYPMNESTGTTITDSVGSLDATSIGTDWVFDELGNPAQLFLDTTDVIGTDNAATTFNQTLYNYTIAWRMNMTNISESFDGDNVLFSYDADPTKFFIKSAIGGQIRTNHDNNRFSNYFVSVDEWHTYAIIYNGATNYTLYVDGVYIDVDTSITLGSKSEQKELNWSYNNAALQFVGETNAWAVWNRTLSDTEIEFWNDSMSNISIISFESIVVNLNEPADDEEIIRTKITFNASVIPESYNLTNATLIVWHSNKSEFNVTTNELTGQVTNQTTWDISNFVFGNYTWNVQSCGVRSSDDSSILCNLAGSNYTLSINEVIFNSITYNPSTLSGSNELFKTNITYNASLFGGINVLLSYNNTNYTASTSDTGDNRVYSKQISVPSVPSSVNKTFWFIVQLSNATGVYNFYSDENNQTVNPFIINETCDTGKYVITNITVLDEKTQVKLNGTDDDVNTTIKVDLKIYNQDRTILVSQFNHSFFKENSAAICIDNNLSGGQNFSMDTQIEYSAIDYSKEFYNIERYTLDSTSLYNNLTLYDLDDANAQKFRLIVKDSSYLPIGNALIQIERKYVENGTTYITEIPKTSANGIASASLELDDVIYNFHIYKGGELIYSFNDMNAICHTPAISTCEIDFRIFQEGISIPNYETGDDFNFTIDYNSTSKTVTTAFIIPSGESAEVKLEVIKEDTLGTDVCEDTLTSVSGTLSCVIPSSFGNSTVRANLYKSNVIQGWGTVKLDQDSSDIFGVILVITSFFVLVTLVGIGVSDNPVITGVSIFIGVVLMFAINLINNTGFVGATATILYLVVAILLVLIKAARRS